MLLKEMSAASYEDYLTTAVAEYAADKVTAGTWSQEEAPILAAESFQRLLPAGVSTKDHQLFSIYLTAEQPAIGVIWLHRQGEKAFIYDFIIAEDYRGKGYGKAALAAVDQWAITQGMTEIGLHVFAHNQTAYQLYKKMGYIATDITMMKPLARD